MNNEFWGSRKEIKEGEFWQGMDSGHYLDIASDLSYSIDLLTISENGEVFAMAVPRDEQFQLVSAEFLYIFKWNADLSNFNNNCGKKILTFKLGRYLLDINQP